MELAAIEGKLAQREPLQHVAYLHDGSLEGLLCCIFEAYVQREVPEDIVRERDYQPRFEQSSFFVQSDFNRALRVRRGIEREAGSQAFGAVVRAAANDDPCAGVIVYRFVRYVMDKRTGRDKRRNVSTTSRIRWWVTYWRSNAVLPTRKRRRANSCVSRISRTVSGLPAVARMRTLCRSS